MKSLTALSVPLLPNTQALATPDLANDDFHRNKGGNGQEAQLDAFF
jgi:hypothetical protein